MDKLKQQINDVFVILRSLWFILLFLGLGFLAFFCVEQGQDMMFAIIDDFKIQPYLWSLLALLVWSAQTSFGARMLVMFSDISFHLQIPESLPEADKAALEAEREVRIKRRQMLASLIPRLLFWAPFAIVTASYIKAGVNYDSHADDLEVLAVIVLMNIAVAYFSHRIGFAIYHKYFKVDQTHETVKAMRALHRVTHLSMLGNVRTGFICAVASAVILIAVYCFLPGSWYAYLGAVHLICMGFGCWIAVFYWVDYIDKHRTVFLKSLLFLYVCLISYYNLDHPLRLEKEACKERSGVIAHFDAWMDRRARALDTADRVPVVFISAEGGACRSGYWVSRILARLQDTCPEFRNCVYSYSSVSGGTIGVNFFNQLNYAALTHQPFSYQQKTDSFYLEDFLAPLTGSMMFGEVINAFSPGMISRFDRAGQLEETWERSWKTLNLDPNLPSAAFTTCMPDTGPAIFINSTEIETGRRALYSNVNITSRHFSSAVDMQGQIGKNIRYSSAMLLSARFPFISPAGMVETKDGRRRHYVDGGYFENKGNITTLELINAVCAESRYRNRIRPVVIMITNEASGADTAAGQRWFNELLEPMVAFMNVRSGHTEHADSVLTASLRNERSNGSLFRLNMGLSGKAVPMNWFLSEHAKEAVRLYMDTSTEVNARVAGITDLIRGNQTGKMLNASR